VSIFVVYKISCRVFGGVEDSKPYDTEGFSQEGEKLDCGMGEMKGLSNEFKKLDRVVFGGLTIRIEDKWRGWSSDSVTCCSD
jgi:hypothetical protein